METKPIAWSFSSLKKFTNCPKRYHEEVVLRSVKQTPTEQTLWGEQVHEGFDKALSKDKPLTGPLTPYEATAERFKHIRGVLKTEQRLAITNTLKPTAWYAPDVWCRGILDAVWLDGEKGKIVDWKTGKRRQGSEQLKLFALLLFACEPQIEKVNASFVWLQSGKMDVEKYNRKDIPILWNDILPDVRRLEMAYFNDNWVPKPSGLCSYCPVRTCSFWKSNDGSRK